MPLYQYHCACGNLWEATNSIEGRNDETCEKCKAPAKIDVAKGGKPVVVNYFSEHLNRQITGPKQKKKVMRQMNVEEA